MSSELEVVSQAIARIDAVSTGLASLEKQYKGVVYEVTKPEGMEAAKAARAAIREPRYNVEKIRKEAKAPILALGKKLDSEAARITAELVKLEDPIDQQIKHEEGRKDRERAEKIAAEERRVTGLRERVAELRGAIEMVKRYNLSASDIANHISDLESVPVDASFQEFQEAAAQAKAETLQILGEMQSAAAAREAEAERLKAERAELERLRAEDAKRQAEERAKRAEEERIAKEAREAENAKQAEILRKEREALDLERAKAAEADRIAREARQAEEARIAAERAALEREQAEARRKVEEAERARLAAEEAERQKKEAAARAAKRAEYPGEDAIVAALAQHFDVPEEVVTRWLTRLMAAA